MTKTRTCRSSAMMLFLMLLPTLPATATDRDRTVALLEAARSAQDATILEAWINDERRSADSGERVDTPLSSPLRYYFASRTSGYLTALRVDAQGGVTVLFPPHQAVAIDAGKVLAFPPDASESTVALPLGNEDLYAFATRQSLTLSGLGMADGEIPFIERHKAPQVIQRLLAQITDAEPVAAVHVGSRVVGRVRTRGSSAPAVLAQDIIAFFTNPRARGMERAPFIDLAIHFETNKSDLTDDSMRQLDEVGKAFSGSGMDELSFVVGGHTDIRGSDQYNMDLSRRRAATVQRYLVDKHGIAAARLEARGYGKSVLVDTEATEDAHAANRRVEFKIKR